MSAILSLVGMLNRRFATAFTSGVLGAADAPVLTDTGFLVDSAANFLVTSTGANIRYVQI